ncbi:MAG: alpha-L-fucosidase, partial [Hyphomonadaceae bacterium]
STGEHMGEKKWEACRGLGLAFGYNQDERTEDYMTGVELIDLYRNLTARGGNLLINVGPMANSAIPDVQKKPLLDLGRAIRAGAVR